MSSPEIDWQPTVVAAGSSSRFGAPNKLFADLCGQPVLWWSIRAMLSVRSEHPLIVVAAEDTARDVRDLASRIGGAPAPIVVRGGPRRRDSVEAALRIASAEYVAVHDGARPLATTDLLLRTLIGASGRPGAAPAVSVSDTVVAVDEYGAVLRHLDRSSLRAIQTPQVVRRSAWLAAAESDPADALDDTTMLARLGLQCSTVEGEPMNLKITRPVDLILARALMSQRGERCTE